MERQTQRPQLPLDASAAAAAAARAAEAIFALYDACWFDRLVLLLPPPAAAAATAAAATPASPPAKPREEEAEVEVQRAPSGGELLRHRRSRSDEAAAAAFEGLEPLRIPPVSSHRACRLETVLSGKDGLAAPQPQSLPERRRTEARRPGRRRRRRGRSMSELEFEEVKGLQDLGFTFSDADVDAELASIVPGLRSRRTDVAAARKAIAATPSTDAVEASNRRQTSAPASSSATGPRRPYLSEAWEDEEETRRMLRDWRIPPAGDGADLKEHLRLWAHTVASAVR